MIPVGGEPLAPYLQMSNMEIGIQEVFCVECVVCVTLIRVLNVDPSKCKRECTWGIKVYVGQYKNICESSGDKVIDHLSNFYVTRIVRG